MSTTSIPKAPKRQTERDILTQAKESLIRNWFYVFVTLLLVWVSLPWLAPVFMRAGWERAANMIYVLYSYQCHQLPQRSFFLFGPETMYSLDQISTAGVEVENLLALRRFIGNADFGYKVAWSDRMVSAYGSIPVAALIWWPLRRRIRSLPIWGFVLLVLPMGIDAGTHFLSDLAGIGQGFRYTNEWLAQLTGNAFPTTFYVGNALGSFNSWMRLITGTLFGASLIWLSFPLFWETALQSKRSRVRSRQAMRLDHD